MIDEIFWWVGATICCAAGAGIAVVAALGVLALLIRVYTALKISRMYRPAPRPALDCCLIREAGRLRFALGVIFGGVPSSIRTDAGTVCWDISWLDKEKSDD